MVAKQELHISHGCFYVTNGGHGASEHSGTRAGCMLGCIHLISWNCRVFFFHLLGIRCKPNKNYTFPMVVSMPLTVDITLVNIRANEEKKTLAVPADQMYASKHATCSSST